MTSSQQRWAEGAHLALTTCCPASAPGARPESGLLCRQDREEDAELRALTSALAATHSFTNTVSIYSGPTALEGLRQLSFICSPFQYAMVYSGIRSNYTFQHRKTFRDELPWLNRREGYRISTHPTYPVSCRGPRTPPPTGATLRHAGIFQSIFSMYI